MQPVLPFTPDRVMDFLDRHNLPYEPDCDNDDSVMDTFVVDLPAHGALWNLAAVGAERSFLKSTWALQAAYPPSAWEKCLIAANSWNVAKRWPTAYLVTDTDVAGANETLATVDETNVGRLFLEQTFFLKAGVHRELLDDLLLSFVAGARHFTNWLDEKHPLD